MDDTKPYHPLRGEGRGGGTHRARHVAAHVHDRVEPAPGERIHPVVPIAQHVLGLRNHVVGGAMEDRDPMPGLEGLLGQRTPREARSADHQEFHGS